MTTPAAPQSSNEDAEEAEDTANTKRIAILGFKGAGKSTFLTILDRALLLRNSRWAIKPIGSTIKTMNALIRRVSIEGLYPLSTPEGEDPPALHFQVERKAAFMGFLQGVRFEIQAADIPGVLTEGIFADEAFSNFYENQVRGCDAIVFLLDPLQVWLQGKKGFEYYYATFNSILAEISQYNSNKIYAAFCITKLDDPSISDYLGQNKPNGDFDRDGHWDDLIGFATQNIIGPATLALIERQFGKNLEWFPISATGYTGSGADRKSQFTMKRVSQPDGHIEDQAGIVAPGDLYPIGVANAMEWVFGSIGGDVTESQAIDRLGERVGRLRRRINR